MFEFAPDAGFGGAIYFDGSEVASDTSNLWWGNNWNNTNEILDTSITGLLAGAHTLDVYWAENCCNGGQSARFSVDAGQSWMSLSVDNIDAASVPEPGSLALFGLGLAGLVVTRKKQQS